MEAHLLQRIPSSPKAVSEAGWQRSTCDISEESSSRSLIPNDKKKNSSLPSDTVEYLKAWMMSPEHVAHPYPTEAEKFRIMADTGIELKQLTNWFVNNRKRYWKPRIEARLRSQHTSTETASDRSLPPVSLTGRAVEAIEVSPSSSSHSGSSRLEGDFASFAGALNTAFERTFSARTVSVSESSQAASHEGSDLSSHSYSDEEENISVADSEESRGSCALTTLYYSGEDARDEFDNISRREVIDVHILRPIESAVTRSDEKRNALQLPTIKDVTILTPKDNQHILRSYVQRPISYTFHQVLLGDRKKMQSRRDAEIVRVKKSFLRQYLFDVGATSFRRKISTRLENRLDIMEEGIANDQDRQTLLRHKRLKFNYDPLSLDVHLKIFSKDMTTVQRDKVSTASEIPSHSRSVNLLNKEGAWKEACRNALLGLETSLPSLDEAVSMFGYQANLPQG